MKVVRLLFLSIPALLLFCGVNMTPRTVVIVSADSEWRALKEIMKPPADLLKGTPYEEWFSRRVTAGDGTEKQVIFFHGGWGKIDAAGSAQYAVDRWKPKRLVNLGCFLFSADTIPPSGARGNSPRMVCAFSRNG